MFGLTAFAVDVGHWYVTGQQAQRAADAAALAGVPNLPGNQTTAFSTAQTFTKTNGFNNAAADTVVVTTGIDGTPTRLRVTVTKTVDNVFGGLFGIDKTTITRTAVADYAGPVPMGSPCNEFGNDPEPGTFKSTNCSRHRPVLGQRQPCRAPSATATRTRTTSARSGVDVCTGRQRTPTTTPTATSTRSTCASRSTTWSIQAFDPA